MKRKRLNKRKRDLNEHNLFHNWFLVVKQHFALYYNGLKDYKYNLIYYCICTPYTIFFFEIHFFSHSIWEIIT